METESKKTKNCIYPWTFAWTDASGALQPCCGLAGNSIVDYGNIRKDFINLKDRSTTNLFNNNEFINLRKSLLDGNVIDVCKKCRIIAEDDITTEELKNKLTDVLRKSLGTEKNIDLEHDWTMGEFIVAMNNKCNLRCIYCSQSVPKSDKNEDVTTTIEWYKAEFTQDEFFDIIKYIYPKGLKIINFCSLSELTLYKGWQKLVLDLKNSFPEIYLTVVTNLSLEYKDSDIDALLLFDQVYISIDTLDEKLFSEVRCGGDIRLIQKNIERLILRKNELALIKPTFLFNVTIYDKSILTLVDLVRYAAAHGINLNFSNLFNSPGTEMEKGYIKKISDMPDSEMASVWEIANSIPRRMKVENRKTDIILTGPFYSIIKDRATVRHQDYFRPRDDELLYLEFVKSRNIIDKEIYLRNIFTEFDEQIRGIYSPVNKMISFVAKLYHVKSIKIKKILVRERDDGNLMICCDYFDYEEIEVSHGLIKLDSSYTTGYYTHMLFVVHEMPELTKLDKIENISLIPSNRDVKLSVIGSYFIRELLLVQDIDRKLREIQSKHDQFIVWCAGSRTKFMLEKTFLRKLNIAFILDTNASLQESVFEDVKVEPPDRAYNFEGGIIICNATNPYAIEKFILDSKKFSSADIYII
jgi:wyosine [tRNA(Phe)-imidazoG37] synthetase (radical SAM superfamily)